MYTSGYLHKMLKKFYEATKHYIKTPVNQHFNLPDHLNFPSFKSQKNSDRKQLPE